MIISLLILLAIMGLVETMFRWGLRKELKRLGYKIIFIFFTFNCFGQFGFGSYNKIPLLVGQSLPNNSTNILLVLYDSFAGINTNSSLNLVNWTNTAIAGSHSMDLMWVTNINLPISSTTNPVYTANAGINGKPSIVLQNAGHNTSIFTTNFCINVPQPFTVIMVFWPTNVTSASVPADHAIWSSNGDYDIGDIGLQNFISPPWIMGFHMDDAGNVFSGAPLATIPYAITTVFNGANTFSRTNGVDYASGNIGTHPFGNDSKGPSYAGFDFGATTGFTPYYIGRWGLWTGQLSTNTIQTIECQWMSDFGIFNANCNVSLPAGLAHWWVASDVPVGRATNWIDRIQGVHAVTNSTTAPISDGVVLNYYGTNSLTVTNLSMDMGATGGDAFCCVFSVNDKNTEQNIIPSNAGNFTGLGILNPGGIFYDPRCTQQPVMTVGSLMSWLYTGQINSNSGIQSTNQVYTNGVSANRACGGGALTWGLVTPSFFGTDGGSEPMSGSLVEIMHWTNMAGMTPFQISSINYYITNTYFSINPIGAVKLVGQSYTMSSKLPLVTAYQWRKAGVDIAGATTSTLTFASEALSDSSTYDCRMTRGSSTIFSTVASNVVVSTTTVSNWCVQVTTNGGVFPTLPTISAVDTFWNGLVTDGIDSKMQDIILMVPDNLIAATTPLVKTLGASPWINHSFVGGDLSVNGLHGNASTKFLDSSINASSTTANDGGLVVYLYSISSGANPIDMGCQIAPNTFFFAPEEAGTMNAGFYNITAGQGLLTAANVSPFYGFYSAQRTGASAAAVYYAMSSHSHASLTTSATTGGSLPAVNIWLFALNNNGSAFGTTDSTISFAAVTKSLNSTQDGNLFSRVQTLRTSLGGGFR